MSYMNTKFHFLFFSIALAQLLNFSNLSAQDLFQERIRKIEGRKKSIYLEKGIIHNGMNKVVAELKSVRHSYVPKRGYERLVFDFSSKKPPRVYGYIAGKEKKLYLDFFDTKLTEKINSFGNSHYVESINFYPVSQDALSIELDFKTNISVDVFYLDSPGRLVVDIKKS